MATMFVRTATTFISNIVGISIAVSATTIKVQAMESKINGKSL